MTHRNEWIGGCMILVILALLITAIVLIATGDGWMEREHRTDPTEKVCTVVSSTCDSNAHTIAFTWIVNCTGELGVVAETRPVVGGSPTCPDLLYPVGSPQICWRRLGEDHQFSWHEHGRRDVDREEHGYGHDDDRAGPWTGGFGIFLLIMVFICVPLVCLAAYWEDVGEPHVV